MGTQETNRSRESIQARRRTKVFARVGAVSQTSMQKTHLFQRKLDHPALETAKNKSKPELFEQLNGLEAKMRQQCSIEIVFRS